jgi:hypothetical protein
MEDLYNLSTSTTWLNYNLKNDAPGFPETLVATYETVRCYNLEYCNLNFHPRETPESEFVGAVFSFMNHN